MNKLLFAFIIFILSISCKNGKNAPNVSNISADVKIQRFDQEFFDTTKPIAAQMDFLQKKYGNVFEFFLFKTGIGDGLSTGLKPENIVGLFLRDHKQLYDTVQKEFKDLSWLQKDLNKALQYFKYYFPKTKDPKVFTMVDGFYPEIPETYYGVDFKDDSLYINLQMFLGKNFTGYDPQVYYDYLRERFTKNYIVKNSINAMLKPLYAAVTDDAPLVEQMIAEGKKIYVLDKILPFITDNIKLGYTERQLKDCYDQEKNIWSYFVNNDNLFSSDPDLAKEYIGENPYTKELGSDSPGNIGVFVGWQIVKKYMEQNKNINLSQLLKVENKIIYTQAKYKP